MGRRVKIIMYKDYDAFGRIVGRLRNNKAFTLAEALVATLIMLLVTVIVAAGIPAAARAYNNVVLASNAEVLLSTTMTSLRNELALAKDIDIPGGTSADGVTSGTAIIYYNPQTGAKSKISCGSTDTDIMYKRYADDGLILDTDKLDDAVSDVYNDNEVRFMSEAASDRDKELHVKFSGVSYDANNGIVKFDELTVTHKGDSSPLAKRDSYSVRIITE